VKLADLVIEFTTKGVEAFRKAIDGAHTKLEQFKGAAQQLGSHISSAFNYASAAIVGFATAGVHASQTGELFRMQFERLSLAIAGLFRPEIQKILELIQRFTNWLNKLDPHMKTMIGHFLAAAIAGLGVSKVLLGPLMSAIQVTLLGMQLLTAAGIELNIVTAGIPLLIGAIVTVFGGLAVGTQTGRNALKGLWEIFKPLIDGLKPIIDIFMEIGRVVGSVFGQAFQVVGIILKSFFSILGAGLSILGAILKVVLLPFTILGRLIEKIMEMLKPLTDKFSELAETLVGKVVKSAMLVVKWVDKMIDKIFDLLGLGKSAVDKDKENRSTEIARSPGFEAPEAVFMRIAAASVNLGAGKSVEEEQLDELRGIRENTGKTHESVENQKPPYTRK